MTTESFRCTDCGLWDGEKLGCREDREHLSSKDGQSILSRLPGTHPCFTLTVCPMWHAQWDTCPKQSSSCPGYGALEDASNDATQTSISLAFPYLSQHQKPFPDFQPYFLYFLCSFLSYQLFMNDLWKRPQVHIASYILVRYLSLHGGNL